MFDTRKTIIMGGEPLLYKDLEYIFSIFPNVTISTNSLLVKKKIKLLSKYRDKLNVQVSIEGGPVETNSIRGNKTWGICMNSVDLLIKNNIKTYLRCSYHMGNIDKIFDEVIPLAEKKGVGVMLLPRIDLPCLDFRSQFEFFSKVIKHKKVAVDQPQFFRFIGKNGRCMAGSERLSVYFDGRITPCNFDLSYTLGHIGDVEDVISKNIKTFLDCFKIIPIECCSCQFSEGCHGGCYISKSFIGCPLRKNLTVDKVIIHDKLDSNMVHNDLNLLVDYVKQLGIC